MTRPRPLHLDFGPAPPPASWLGFALLAAGIVACGAMAVDYQAAEDDLLAVQARLQAVSRVASRQPQAPAAGETAVRQAAVAARALRRPWDAILGDLERASDPAVALLAVEPDPNRQQLRLTGEAGELKDVLAFISRLEKGKRLKRPTLTSYQSKQVEGMAVVAFTLTAEWRED